MKDSSVNIPQDKLAEFCRRNLISRLSLFGSVLRDDFDRTSDVDILVEFDAASDPSLLDLGSMQQELCEMLGRQVDLKTPEFLSTAIRSRVVNEAQVQYAA